MILFRLSAHVRLVLLAGVIMASGPHAVSAGELERADLWQEATDERASLRSIDALRPGRIDRDGLERPFRPRPVNAGPEAPQYRLNNGASLWVDARRGVGLGTTIRF